MHYGSIDKSSACARVLEVLKSKAGEWVSGWDLTVNSFTTAVGTRISEIRAQSARLAELGYKLEMKREGRGFFYRVVSINS